MVKSGNDEFTYSNKDISAFVNVVLKVFSKALDDIAKIP